MRIIVLDTETTGLPSGRYANELARIVEVGAVLFDTTSSAIVAEFESLCNPGPEHFEESWASEALVVNRIDRDWIRRAPSDRDVGLELRRWVLSQKPDCIVAFNNDFDFHPLLLGSRVWLAPLLDRIPEGPCLMEAYKAHVGLGTYEPGGRLANAAQRFNIPAQGTAHSALADARTAALLIPHVWPVDYVPPVFTEPLILTREQATEKESP